MTNNYNLNGFMQTTALLTQGKLNMRHCSHHLIPSELCPFSIFSPIAGQNGNFVLPELIFLLNFNVIFLWS